MRVAVSACLCVLLGAAALAACSESESAPSVGASEKSAVPSAMATSSASSAGGKAAASQAASGATGLIINDSEQPVSEVERQFFAAIGGGFPGVTRDVAVSMAERTCGAFSEGSAAVDIRAVLTGKGLTDSQSARLVLAAVSTYCPEFRDRAMG